MKQLFGIDTDGSYAFDRTLKTVTFSGLTLTLNNILLINNATANRIIYNFADPAVGAASFSDNVLTLDYDTSAMNNTDLLQIWVDLPQQASVKTRDSGNPDTVLARLLASLVSPKGYDYTTNRMRQTAVIESGTVTTVSTVTTVTTVTTVSTVSTVSNIAAFGGVQAQIPAANSNAMAWQLSHRSHIV